MCSAELTFSSDVTGHSVCSAFKPCHVVQDMIGVDIKVNI